MVLWLYNIMLWIDLFLIFRYFIFQRDTQTEYFSVFNKINRNQLLSLDHNLLLLSSQYSKIVPSNVIPWLSAIVSPIKPSTVNSNLIVPLTNAKFPVLNGLMTSITSLSFLNFLSTRMIHPHGSRLRRSTYSLRR